MTDYPGRLDCQAAFKILGRRSTTWTATRMELLQRDRKANIDLLETSKNANKETIRTMRSENKDLRTELATVKGGKWALGGEDESEGNEGSTKSTCWPTCCVGGGGIREGPSS